MNHARAIAIMNRSSHRPNSQQGVALVISLVFLLLLTLIGLATMRSTTLQESMASNVQDKMLAFEAAEAALRAGERTIANYTTSPDAVTPATGAGPGTGKVWASDAFKWDEVDWAAQTIEYDTTLAGVDKPRFAIEYQARMEGDPDNLALNPSYSPVKRYIYRVTAHATGRSNKTEVVLQSTTLTRLVK